MRIYIKLIKGKEFLIKEYPFENLLDNQKQEIITDLPQICSQIFNIISIYGPKAIAIKIEPLEFHKFTYESIKSHFAENYNLHYLGGNIEISSVLPYYEKKPIYLKSKQKSLEHYFDHFAVGISITRKEIYFIVLNQNMHILKKEQFNISYNIKDNPEKLIDIIKKKINAFNFEFKNGIKTIGIALPGEVHPYYPKNSNFKMALDKQVNIPIIFENDGNSVAIALKQYNGITEDFVSISIDDYVGGGIISQGHLIKGENFFGGEIGHIIIDHSSSALECECGNKGCIEAYISELSLQNYINNTLEIYRNRPIEQLFYDKKFIKTPYFSEIKSRIKKISLAVLEIEKLTKIKKYLITTQFLKLGEIILEILKNDQGFIEHINEKSIIIDVHSKTDDKLDLNHNFLSAIGVGILSIQKSEEIIEKSQIIIPETYEGIGKVAAKIIAQQIKRKPNSVLGFATGSTPVSMYDELIRYHIEEELDFSQVITFNLDEYYPIKPENPQSYRYYMNDVFFKYININPNNIHTLSGTISEEEIEMAAQKYEELIKSCGGIDIQILGIGGSFYEKGQKNELIFRGGHIGFNESGSAFSSRTRKITLAAKTKTDNARFFKNIDDVPNYAITMGIGSILESKRILLLASGEHKAEIVKKAVEGDITEDIPASALQLHPNTTFIIEQNTSLKLSRMELPWLFFNMDWNREYINSVIGENLIDHALYWLSDKLKKPLHELTIKDLENNYLKQLVEFYHNDLHEIIQNAVFRLKRKILMHDKIPKNKKICIISPHPDDDVFSMGAVIKILVENNNSVSIIYITSGNFSVKKKFVISYCKLNKFKDILSEIECDEIGKQDLLDLKARLRKEESINAQKVLGIPEENLYSFSAEFYETGTRQKSIVTSTDVFRLRNILQIVEPEICFIPHGFKDPHGTQKKSIQLFNKAIPLVELKQKPTIWQYKTAWDEFSIHQANIIIPFTKEKMNIQIKSIKEHKSQLRPLFPGKDPREFWEIAQDRNEKIGIILNALGVITKPYQFATLFLVKNL